MLNIQVTEEEFRQLVRYCDYDSDKLNEILSPIILRKLQKMADREKYMAAKGVKGSPLANEDV